MKKNVEAAKSKNVIWIISKKYPRIFMNSKTLADIS